MASTAQLAPFTRDTIEMVLRNSTAAAVNSCRGPGNNGRACGFRWTTGGYDGLTGAGQEMSVLAALSSLLAFSNEQGNVDGKNGGRGRGGGPLTGETGGTSKGDPHAGTGAGVDDPTKVVREVTRGDKAGAWLLTVFTLGTILAAFVLMGTGWFEDREGVVAAADVAGEKTHETKTKKEMSIWNKLARVVIFRH